MSESEPYRRRSARVLLLDGAGRILLLRSLFDVADPEQGHFWLTPGGGVNDGEPLPLAAARELYEEVGLLAAPEELGEPVAHTSGYAAFTWASGVFRDDFFCHRVERHEVDVSRMEELEAGNHAGHRWWTLDELASTSEIVYPLGLAALLADLLGGRVPSPPVELPWHH